VSKDFQDALIVVLGMAGLGTVGSGIGILWYRIVAPSSLSRDTVLFILKLFFGIGACGTLAYFLFKYIWV
jgi:hypothetical protein